MLATLEQREHDGGQAGGGEHRAALVQPRRLWLAGLGDDARREQQRGDADRDVDQEAAAPPEPGWIRRDQCPADQLTADRGQAHHCPVHAERPQPVGAGIQHADN
jgi:hypothetical protein